jgi:hypothetical protein
MPVERICRISRRRVVLLVLAGLAIPVLLATLTLLLARWLVRF